MIFSKESLKPVIYDHLRKAQLACQKWQDYLRLSDWDVRVEIVRQSRLGECSADINYHCGKKCAILRILDPVDVAYYDTLSTDYWPIDHDLSIVHELLHLLFAGFEPDSDVWKDNILEFAVNTLARTIVYSYREKEVLS